MNENKKILLKNEVKWISDEKDAIYTMNIHNHLDYIEKIKKEVEEVNYTIELIKEKMIKPNSDLLEELQDKVAMNSILANAKSVVVPEGKGIFWTNKIESLERNWNLHIQSETNLHDHQNKRIKELELMQETIVETDPVSMEREISELKEEIRKGNEIFADHWKEIMKLKTSHFEGSCHPTKVEDIATLIKSLKNQEVLQKLSNEVHNILRMLNSAFTLTNITIEKECPHIIKRVIQIREKFEGENSMPKGETVSLEKPPMAVKENMKPLQNSKPSVTCWCGHSSYNHWIGRGKCDLCDCQAVEKKKPSRKDVVWTEEGAFKKGDGKPFDLRKFIEFALENAKVDLPNKGQINEYIFVTKDDLEKYRKVLYNELTNERSAIPSLMKVRDAWIEHLSKYLSEEKT